MIHSHIIITNKCITNQQNDQLPDGLLAQLVEHCTSITEVHVVCSGFESCTGFSFTAV